MKIVVVDDDPVVGILCDELFSAQGHTVEVLYRGSKCLEHILNSPPDILILDMIMPDISGIELLKQIKSNNDTSEIPVIMLSANGNLEDIANDNDVKANLYLEKPFKLDEILDAIKEFS